MSNNIGMQELKLCDLAYQGNSSLDRVCCTCYAVGISSFITYLLYTPCVYV